jgi:hypothetical protein
MWNPFAANEIIQASSEPSAQDLEKQRQAEENIAYIISG